jgi:hypothetical protein
MARLLTSWKEIAQYAGKSVRTVQRWETNLGFPVRRAHQDARGTVIAFADEIDSWLHSTFSSHPAPAELEEARREITRLSTENEDLRRRLASLQKFQGKHSA